MNNCDDYFEYFILFKVQFNVPSESESSDEKGKSSRKRFDPSTEGNSGKAVSKRRIDERPKERRQRHDTE